MTGRHKYVSSLMTVLVFTWDFSFIEFSKPDGVIFLKGSGDPVNR
jgi:hypothetical protein